MNHVCLIPAVKVALAFTGENKEAVIGQAYLTSQAGLSESTPVDYIGSALMV